MKSSAVWGPQHKRPGRVFMVMALGVGIAVGSAQGQTISFFRTFSTPGIDRATAVAADASGIYVFGIRPAPGGGEGSAGARKYDSRGDELWTREVGAPTSGAVDWIVAAAASPAGVYIAGQMTPPAARSFVRQYSAAGSELWTREFPPGLWASGLAADATGVYVAGADGNPDNPSSFVRKYGATGSELWTREVPPGSSPSELAVDRTGVYVASYVVNVPEGFISKYGPGGNDLWTRQLDFHPSAVAAADGTAFFATGSDETGSFLRKYDAAGNELWTRPAPVASKLAADATGVYVVGFLDAHLFAALPGQCKSGSHGDSFVRKYDPSGAELWTREFGTAHAAGASGVAVDASGVYVAGSDDETLGLLDDTPALSSAFLAKFEKAAAVVPDSRPHIFPGCIVNAASYRGGGVAPGEIVTIFGLAMGPPQAVPLQLTEDGRLSTSLADTRILFNGVPAPLLYVSGIQSSAVVPYAVADGPSVDVRVEYKGVGSAPVTMPVLASRPGIFSLDASGQGQGAILNEDGSLNSPSNPAQRGSIVTIYATGGGETAPGVVDGQILGHVLPRTTLPVSAFFYTGYSYDDVHMEGEVVYAGGASGLVAGLLQVSVRVPPDLGAGNAAQISLTIGSNTTGFQVTLALP